MDATLAPPVLIPARNALPLLLSIPHSGRDYPDWLLGEARHGRRALMTLEDPLVDRLAWRAIAAGFGAVVARTPRGAMDCNRSPDELDPHSIASDPVSGTGSKPEGPRARHGLGIIASRTRRHGQLWRRPLPRARFSDRLAIAYHPYHATIAAELDRLAAAHGGALLLDLHSMPPCGPGKAQVVIGDRHGTSAGCQLGQRAAKIAEAAGFSATLNDPYAGGHIAERHGRPRAGIHALQIELDRSAYLANDLMSPGVGFDRCSRLLALLAEGLACALVEALARAVDANPAAIAAE